MIKASKLLAAGLLLLLGQIRAEGGMDDGGPMLAMHDEGGPGGGGMGGPGMRGGGGPERMLEQLDLSADQKEKLKALRRARRDKNQARMNALEDAREDLKDLLGKADRSKEHEAKLRAKHQAIAKLEAEQGDDRFESMLEVRNILTDSQLKKFIELKEKHHGMGMKGMKGGKRGGHEHGDDKEGKRP